MTTAMVLGVSCELGEVLGSGGMGRVYAAEHPTRAHIAIKLLHESLRSDPVMRAHMSDEAAAAGRVRHRNVVRVLDHGIASDGTPFVAMERATGTLLGAAIRRRGPLEFAAIRSIAPQLLLGLAAIHNTGLVHGDVKSDNILVDLAARDRRTTIIDFGLARPSASRSIDENDLISGTPDYMAPELIRGEPVTAAADLYAVGVILYEMLTGTTPFGGGTAAMIFERHLEDEVVPPSLRSPERVIPIALETAILRALDKDPDRRFSDAAMFATAIERAIPAHYDDHLAHDESAAFSTTAVTRDWERVRVPRRVANGTDAPKTHRLEHRRRDRARLAWGARRVAAPARRASAHART